MAYKKPKKKKKMSQEDKDLLAAEKEYFSDPKNVPKKSKTMTVNLTQDEIDLLEAEKAFFADPKNKRKKWDYKDPEIHKRYKGGLMVKPQAAKRGY